MRIAHISSTFPPYQAGTGNVCFYNCRELARRGHEIHVFTARIPGIPAFEVMEGVQVHRLPAIVQMGNAPLLPGLLTLADFDLIHLHYPFIFGAELIWLVALFRHIPYVFTYHNDLIGVGVRKILFKTYIGLTAPAFFGRASRLLTVSKDHAIHCDLAGLFHKRWDRTIEVANGVDTSAFRVMSDPAAARRAHGIPPNAKVVCFVGALDLAHHYKGIARLLRAFAALDGENQWLLIVGDGDMRSAYQDQAASLGISDRCVFAGRLQHDQLPAAIAAGDVLVLPSSAESFGMVLVEAMACGRAVIASDLPGVRTVVVDGENGLLVPPGNVEELSKSIRSLFDDPERCVQMGLAGRRRAVEKYDWAAVVNELERVYEDVLRE